MHMLYNSDSFVVVQIEVPGITPAGEAELSHGGYEIVDKFAGKEIFIQGAMAESFKQGVEALIRGKPSEDEVDDYLARFSSLMQQPVVLH